MIDDQDKASIAARKRSTPASNPDVDAFLKEMQSSPTNGGGRLIFAVDATASREAMWDTACKLQVEMFRAGAATGGLQVQLVYYRGISECRVSKWVSEPALLARLMEKVMCRAGETQINRVLQHALRESERGKVSALVFVGDAMEENPDALAHQAGELGRLGVPAFMFRKETTIRSSAYSGTSLSSLEAPMAASTPDPRASWPNC